MDKGLVTEKFISILNEAADKGIPLLRSKAGGVAMAEFKWNKDIENFASTGKLGAAEIVQWKELNLEQQHTLLEMLNKYHNADDGEKLINVDMILCAMKAPGYEGVAKDIEKANTWVPESIWRPLAVTYQSQRPALGLDSKFHHLKGKIDGQFTEYDQFLSEIFPRIPQPESTPEPTFQPTPEPTFQPTPEPTAQPTPEPTAQPTPEPTPEPKTIKVVRHRYGKGEAHDRAVAHAKRRNSDPKRLTPEEREIALQNLQRMEELGLIAKGPEGTSNSEVYLYRLYQSTLYYHLNEKIKMSDGSYEPVSSALGSESGKNHKEVYKDLTTQQLDDDTLEDYARTVNMTEGCITNKGEARTTHKIPVRGKYSFKAGISSNVEIAEEIQNILNNTDQFEDRIIKPDYFNGGATVLYNQPQNNSLKNAGQQYTEESKEYDGANAVALKQSNKSSGMC